MRCSLHLPVLDGTHWIFHIASCMSILCDEFLRMRLQAHASHLLHPDPRRKFQSDAGRDFHSRERKGKRGWHERCSLSFASQVNKECSRSAVMKMPNHLSISTGQQLHAWGTGKLRAHNGPFSWTHSSGDMDLSSVAVVCAQVNEQWWVQGGGLTNMPATFSQRGFWRPFHCALREGCVWIIDVFFQDVHPREACSNAKWSRTSWRVEIKKKGVACWEMVLVMTAPCNVIPSCPILCGSMSCFRWLLLMSGPLCVVYTLANRNAFDNKRQDQSRVLCRCSGFSAAELWYRWTVACGVLRQIISLDHWFQGADTHSVQWAHCHPAFKRGAHNPVSGFPVYYAVVWVTGSPCHVQRHHMDLSRELQVEIKACAWVHNVRFRCCHWSQRSTHLSNFPPISRQLFLLLAAFLILPVTTNCKHSPKRAPFAYGQWSNGKHGCGCKDLHLRGVLVQSEQLLCSLAPTLISRCVPPFQMNTVAILRRYSLWLNVGNDWDQLSNKTTSVADTYSSLQHFALWVEKIFASLGWFGPRASATLYGRLGSSDPVAASMRHTLWSQQTILVQLDPRILCQVSWCMTLSFLQQKAAKLFFRTSSTWCTALTKDVCGKASCWELDSLCVWWWTDSAKRQITICRRCIIRMFT